MNIYVRNVKSVKRLIEKSMKIKGIFLYLFFLLSSVISAEDIPKKLTIIPSVGISGSAFPTYPTEKIAEVGGVIGSLAAEYKVIGIFSLGARLGAAYFPYSSWFMPQWAGILAFEMSQDFSLGLEIGVLPGISFSYLSHQILLTGMPFYMISGGATFFNLQYGYRIPL